MITRVVKLSFAPQNTEAFKKIFLETNSRIQEFQGCIEVKGFQDASNPCVFFTISKWESEHDLNQYRQSEFFESVWSRTKVLFNDKPQAWSMEEIGQS